MGGGFFHAGKRVVGHLLARCGRINFTAWHTARTSLQEKKSVTTEPTTYNRCMTVFTANTCLQTPSPPPSRCLVATKHTPANTRTNGTPPRPMIAPFLIATVTTSRVSHPHLIQARLSVVSRCAYPSAMCPPPPPIPTLPLAVKFLTTRTGTTSTPLTPPLSFPNEHKVIQTTPTSPSPYPPPLPPCPAVDSHSIAYYHDQLLPKPE